MTFSSNSNSDSLCNKIKDPFQERISCIDKINNCMYCENQNSCQKCNEEYSLFNGQCLPSIDFQANLKYFTPDNEINYYTWSSRINGCEECTYHYFSFNKFHCKKCSIGLKLSLGYECIGESVDSTNLMPEVIFDPIVIASNFDQKIKAGDKIEFQIMQIHKSKYNLNNNQIVFEDIGKTKALYFKSCQQYLKNIQALLKHLHLDHLEMLG